MKLVREGTESERNEMFTERKCTREEWEKLGVKWVRQVTERERKRK